MLFGPATSVLSAMIECRVDGRAEGVADAGGCSVAIRGADLRAVLREIFGEGGPDSGPPAVAETRRFIEALEPSSMYHVDGYEF